MMLDDFEGDDIPWALIEGCEFIDPNATIPDVMGAAL